MSNGSERPRKWWKPVRLDDQPVPEEDPITNSSLATPIALTSLLLIVTLIWAMWQEVFGLRPWIDYQQQWTGLYRNHLIDIRPLRDREEERLAGSPGYQELSSQLEQARAAIQDDVAEIRAREDLINAQLAAVTNLFTTERSRIQATIYNLETAGGESRREALREELEALRRGPYAVMVPTSLDEPGTPQDLSFEELEDLFNRLKVEQGQLQSRIVALRRKPQQLQTRLQQYASARLTGLTPQQVDGLLSALDNFEIGIRQIHNPEAGLVDRCESCHLGIREPVEIRAEDMNGQRVFVSHPSRELLQIHNPEVYGCSPCHNGNGVGTVSVARAHGSYRHWLWPLYPPENFEAGCQQCHEADRQLQLAPTLNAGKQLFYEKGCWGCHPREGFDVEAKALRETANRIAELEGRREQTQHQINRTVARADAAASNEEANRLYARAEAMTMGIADIDAELALAQQRVEELLLETKTQGPNLKEVRNKLRREWLPVWIQDPHEFRPTTRMPRFRLDQSQVRAISAFIWQSGVEAAIPAHPRGDAARGETLFETRGCLACHSIGSGDEVRGGTFAANLSRVGEKADYDYLVRWIHDPRERTLPFCPTHGRDMTPQDYAAAGLPFRFDLEHNQCPLGEHPLQVQQLTVMPSLRLSTRDARDIASYLTAQRTDAVYPDASFLDDPDLVAQGRDLVRHFGCAGCHEIAGLEAEGKIGTDLTQEGSKPIERLDFALLTHDAKAEGWYDHKGFFERKLRNPDVFDQGKIKEPLEKLRMPEPNVSEEEITQLTTFLLGSVDSIIPEPFKFKPLDQRRDIQEGWWVVAKYNCMGCHQFTPGQSTVLEALPRYQGEGKEQLPPSVVGEGARVDADWLARFLKNPALSDRDTNRNGVRPYLEVRMPTFNLSDGEVQKLVRFFNALSKQPLPYLKEELEPLSRRELTMARDLFTHRAAPCLRCHATGNPVTDPNATAPNFVLVPERLKRDWTQRWLVHPEIIRPGTAMPSGLFRREGERWVFALGDVASLRGYGGDHVELLVRYMFEFSAEEQRRLSAR